jgi:MYXO-CTERM domain-containing protein
MSATVLTWTAVASSYDALASPCHPFAVQCMRAPIAFDASKSLPIEFDFDSGWVPSGGDLQVHLWGKVFATTRLSLGGALEARWPAVAPGAPPEGGGAALALAAPGDPDGGLLAYHYGVDAGAEAKVNIKIFGKTYSWQGDIPYVPQIDFQVEGTEIFDAWGWPPGAQHSDATKPATVAQVDVTKLIGPSIPGLSGGFELNVALDVTVRWVNDRIVLRTPDGEPVAGGDIEAADGTSSVAYAGEAAVELDVHPEGTMRYEQVLHLIPSFYVELLGKKWSIPIVDYPQKLPATDEAWVLDDRRVRVPLPDVEREVDVIDFGTVAVGEETFRKYEVRNDGEAAALVAIAVSDPETFPLWDEALAVEPGDGILAALRFAPRSAGVHTAVLTLASNDPDAPSQTIELTGVGTETGASAPVDPGGGSEADGGCGCRLAPSAPGRAPLLWLGAVLAFALRRRRMLAALAGIGIGGAACSKVVPFEGKAPIKIAAAPPASAPAPEPPKRVEVTSDKIVIHEKIQFEHDQARILEVSFGLLDEVASVIQKNGQIRRIQIEGHASAEGNEHHNRRLSESRAKAVMEHLIKKGVAKERLLAKGFGSSKPLASNDDEAGREKNRRVEFNILEQEAAAAAAEAK